jgi:hypothetical protein
MTLNCEIRDTDGCFDLVLSRSADRGISKPSVRSKLFQNIFDEQLEGAKPIGTGYGKTRKKLGGHVPKTAPDDGNSYLHFNSSTKESIDQDIIDKMKSFSISSQLEDEPDVIPKQTIQVDLTKKVQASAINTSSERKDHILSEFFTGNSINDDKPIIPTPADDKATTEYLLA